MLTDEQLHGWPMPALLEEARRQINAAGGWYETLNPDFPPTKALLLLIAKTIPAPVDQFEQIAWEVLKEHVSPTGFRPDEHVRIALAIAARRGHELAKGGAQ